MKQFPQPEATRPYANKADIRSSHVSPKRSTLKTKQAQDMKTLPSASQENPPKFSFASVGKRVLHNTPTSDFAGSRVVFHHDFVLPGFNGLRDQQPSNEKRSFQDSMDDSFSSNELHSGTKKRAKLDDDPKDDSCPTMMSSEDFMDFADFSSRSLQELEIPMDESVGSESSSPRRSLFLRATEQRPQVQQHQGWVLLVPGQPLTPWVVEDEDDNADKLDKEQIAHPPSSSPMEMSQDSSYDDFVLKTPK